MISPVCFLNKVFAKLRDERLRIAGDGVPAPSTYSSLNRICCELLSSVFKCCFVLWLNGNQIIILRISIRLS